MLDQVWARLICSCQDALRDMNCCWPSITSKGVSMSLDAYTEMARDQGILWRKLGSLKCRLGNFSLHGYAGGHSGRLPEPKDKPRPLGGSETSRRPERRACRAKATVEICHYVFDLQPTLCGPFAELGMPRLARLMIGWVCGFRSWIT